MMTKVLSESLMRNPDDIHTALEEETGSTTVVPHIPSHTKLRNSWLTWRPQMPLIISYLDPTVIPERRRNTKLFAVSKSGSLMS